MGLDATIRTKDKEISNFRKYIIELDVLFSV